MSELKNKTNCETVMGDKTPADIVSIKVKDQEELKLDNLKIKAVYTPGHTFESFSFLMEDRVFTGDTLLMVELVEQIFKTEIHTILIIQYLIFY